MWIVLKNKKTYIIQSFAYVFAGPPDPPSGCDVHNHTMKSLFVSCGSVGYNGGDHREVVKFHIVVRDRLSGTVIKNQTRPSPKFNLG